MGGWRGAARLCVLAAAVALGGPAVEVRAQQGPPPADPYDYGDYDTATAGVSQPAAEEASNLWLDLLPFGLAVGGGMGLALLVSRSWHLRAQRRHP